MHILDKIKTIWNSLFYKKEVLPDYDTWYDNLFDNSTKHEYMFYFSKGMESYKDSNGEYKELRERLEELTGIHSFPYYRDDFESDGVYIYVCLNRKEFREYCKVARMLGGELQWQD